MIPFKMLFTLCVLTCHLDLARAIFFVDDLDVAMELTVGEGLLPAFLLRKCLYHAL